MAVMLMLRVLIQSPMVMIITLLFKWFLCIVFARVDLFGAILLIVCHISQTHSNPFLRRCYWFHSSFMYIIIVLYLHVCSLHSMFLTSPHTPFPLKRRAHFYSNLKHVNAIPFRFKLRPAVTTIAMRKFNKLNPVIRSQWNAWLPSADDTEVKMKWIKNE